MFDLDKLVRENIKRLVPYSSARDEFKGKASIFLDANENTHGSPIEENVNRYPDPFQLQLKEKISRVKGVPVKNIFLGNGSDEVIDLIYRAFCEPKQDNVIICPPTYGMFEVLANINNVSVKKVPFSSDFILYPEKVLHAVEQDGSTKIIFLCSPNNPTGNSVLHKDIEFILSNFDGIVVVDEAYINFSRQKSFIDKLTKYPNLIIIQTLSKAWGMAGLRIGMAFASEGIIAILNKIKPPYNINQASQQLAIKALDNVEQINQWIKKIVHERENLKETLKQFPFIEKIYPSDANFLLIKTTEPKKIYRHLVNHGIIVRDRSSVILCEGCLRITIGTTKENQKLLEVLNTYK